MDHVTHIGLDVHKESTAVAILRPGFLSAGLLRRAVEIDARFADLDLGLTDACVMAYAELRDLPILTFDFEGFPATAPPRHPWGLVVDEARYRDATG